MEFSELGLHPDVLDGIDALNFKTATPIQAQAIPLILQGRDLIGVAQTGTGKTAAFVLPIIDLILDEPSTKFVQALIVVPTRELAMQINKAIEAYSYFTGTSSIAIYGGGSGADASPLLVVALMTLQPTAAASTHANTNPKPIRAIEPLNTKPATLHKNQRDMLCARYPKLSIGHCSRFPRASVAMARRRAGSSVRAI